MKSNTLGLGIDAGGTQTRWALATAGGDIVADGSVAGLSALQLATAAGREQVSAVIGKLAADVLTAGTPGHVYAGVTGLDDEQEEIKQLIAAPLGLAVDAVDIKNDIEIACRALFAPGEGYLVYAGTGTIAAYIDAHDQLQRAGGRGAMLDDAGGGYWIAHEALQLIWRREDVQPGAWRDSPMATEMLKRIGGTDWSHSRKYIYGRGRGDIGQLALAVAACAETDPAAADILQRAGRELARLAKALLVRFGPRPIILTGRAWRLHPSIEASLRDALDDRIPITLRDSEAHLAAARFAARDIRLHP
ncbi:MAG: ATPase [Betaproteobacteria bacterium]|nr:ATPase [Betaproteobacteria bacterium]